MRLRGAFSLMGLLLGCAASTPSRPSASAPLPEPAAESPVRPPPEAPTARELAELPRRQVAAPGDAFTGEVEAAEAPTFQTREDALVLSVPLGTRSPMTCFVYAEPLEAGGALHRLMALAARRTRVRSARITDVRLLAGAPAVFAELTYRSDTPGGESAGQVKMMVHVDERVPLVCTHDEPGYVASFARIAGGLAGSLKGAGGEAPRPPRYTEFHVMRVREAPVGFEWRVVRDAAGSGRLTQVVTSLFFPRAVWELTAQDTVSTELSDKDGVLVARDDARAINGELDLRMSLEQVKGREYHYEGRVQGKDVSGAFTAPAALASAPGMTRALREWLEGKGPDALTLQLYSPELNPVAPVAQVLRRGKGEGGREVEAELGGGSATLVLDANGAVERLVMPLGENLRMVRERVSATGVP